MSVTEAAEKLGVSRQMLHGILAEKHAITPEMAVRLGKFCGNGPGIWLRMQQNHDLWKAECELTTRAPHRLPLPAFFRYSVAAGSFLP